MDNLTYTYSGNRLTAVEDAIGKGTPTNALPDFKDRSSTGTNEYGYDANGNLTRDDNKGITNIVYNFLNKPCLIQFGTNRKIEYFYDANGTKLTKKVTIVNGQTTTTTRTDYIGGFIYTDNVLSSVSLSNGRLVKKPDGSFDQQYYLKDHLGNVRVVFGADSQGKVVALQEDSYYPYGMTMSGLSTVSTLPNNYKYQSKEYQSEGFDTDNNNTLDTYLAWYDFDARFFDPQLGRWHVPDPANQYASPYVGMGNNPANRIDPDGREDNMRNYWINYYREINMFATTQSYSRYLEQDRWYGRGMYEGNPQFYWLANVSSGGFNATFSPQGGHSSPDGPSTIILAGDYISDNGGKIVHSNLYTSANHPGELGAYVQVNLSPGKGGSTVYTKDYKGNITGHISVTEAARCIWVSAGSSGEESGFIDKGLDIAAKLNNLISASAMTLSTNGLATRMVNVGKSVIKYSTPTGIAINAVQVAIGIRKDGFTIGPNALNATAQGVSSIAGAWVGFRLGALAGFEIGFNVGLYFEGVGAIPGAIIGGIVGGFLGAWGGAYGGNELGGYLIINKIP